MKSRGFPRACINRFPFPYPRRAQQGSLETSERACRDRGCNVDRTDIQRNNHVRRIFPWGRHVRNNPGDGEFIGGLLLETFRLCRAQRDTGPGYVWRECVLSVRLRLRGRFGYTLCIPNSPGTEGRGGASLRHSSEAERRQEIDASSRCRCARMLGRSINHQRSNSPDDPTSTPNRRQVN